MSFANSDDFGGMQPKPKKSNALWWILGILTIVTMGGALLCCGGIYYMVSVGSQMIAAEVKRGISNDPTIKEQIGDVAEMNFNFSATSAAGGGETLVFDIKGEKGAGQLEVVVDKRQDAQPTISSATLILPNGERHEIELAEPPAELAPPAEPATPQPVEVEETPEAEAESIQPADAT